jgi:TonB-dependent SusC/RagA subfamily outer membrane receptor
MEPVITYFIKVATAIAAFYLFYHLFLRHRKDFRFNRIYLMGSCFLSLLIPLITFTLVRPATRQLVILPEETIREVSAINNGPAIPDLMTCIWSLSAGITLFFLLRLMAGYGKAFSIVRKCRVTEISGIRVHVSSEDIHPFTFFNRIVFPGGLLAHPDQTMILKHEQVHAQERHSLDILFSEIFFLFQWFNPFAWLLKEAVRNNLEFLTDQEVLHHSDMQVYQMAMVSLAGKKGAAPFLNALNGSYLKNRIIMMKKKTENKNNVSRRLMVIPLLTLLIAGLSKKEFKAASFPGGLETNNAVLQSLNLINSTDTLKKKNRDELFVVGYPAKSAKSGDSNKSEQPAGTVMIRKSSGLNPADKETASETGAGTTNKEITAVGYAIKKEGRSFTGDSLIVRMVDSGKGTKPVYVLDGKEIVSLDGISPESIESISVLKDESATALYGEKGKNGVIMITSKKTGQPSDYVLIVVDGEETKKKMEDINPNDIQSVKVLKEKLAVTKYGDKGKNGVVEITMKKGAEIPTGKITDIDLLRKRIAQSILYPKDAIENGEQCVVEVYAFVNGEGAITQITTTPPSSDFQKVDEVVIIGYVTTSITPKEIKNSSSLEQEASLQIKKLPDLAIDRLKNKWVEFRFNFRLEKQ